ncbi:hypothetical protein E2C01_074547 [Portunus trituberculatus]|uniref:Uncharacterized protein n=1 Tax=Portunus trituberculatus TaxID=210409 RepID=A0A5B7IEK4_PORTR|nr:hypothetical protein [Portunus trituberculatus]
MGHDGMFFRRQGPHQQSCDWPAHSRFPAPLLPRYNRLRGACRGEPQGHVCIISGQWPLLPLLATQGDPYHPTRPSERLQRHLGKKLRRERTLHMQ